MMEYYLAVKRKEILIHGSTWMNPEDTTLSESVSHRRTNAVQFHLHEVPRADRSTDRKDGEGQRLRKEEGDAWFSWGSFCLGR